MEIIPWTPLISGGVPLLSSRPIRRESSTFCSAGRLDGLVCPPHSGQEHMKVFLPQAVHCRMPISTSSGPAVMAVETRRCMPPAVPRGNKVWGGGFIFRSLAFSGRPMRAPMRATARARTSMPMAADTALRDAES